MTPEVESLAPERELLDPCWLGFLDSQARLLQAHLNLWAPDLSPIRSWPADRAPSDAGALRDLVRRCLLERRPLWNTAGDAAPSLAVPVLAAAEVVAVLTARPRSIHEPRPAGIGSAEGPGRGLIAPGDAASAEPACDTGPWSDPRRPAAPPAPGAKAPPELAVLRSSLQATAVLLGQHRELLQQAAAQTDELAALRDQSDLMHRFAGKRGDPADWRETIEFILQQGCAATGADVALLQLPNERAPMIVRPAPSRGGVKADPKELRQLAAQIWWSMRGWPTPQVQGPLEKVLGHAPAIPGRLQVAAVRLCPARPKAGFLAFLRRGARPFAPHQLGLLEGFADQVAMGVRDADLHEDLSEFLMSTVKALVCAIEAKDSYTSGHSARVNLIAMLIGKQLDLPGEQMETLKWASILHDVGKIGMPGSILKKPGRLDDAEYEIVKEHPWRGYEVVGKIRQLKTASQAVLFHHERLDGLGYPLGISGEAIPRAARIIAVADSFDALITRRPYRDPWSIDDAYAEINRASGTHFDPPAVQALGQLLPFIREHRVMLESADQAA